MFIKLARISKKDVKFVSKGFYRPSGESRFKLHALLTEKYGYKIDMFGWENQIFDSNNKKMSWFGVADNEEQVIEYYKSLDELPRKFVVGVTKVKKENCGLWKWNDWGKYIGEEKPLCIYLEDEPEINAVVCFRLYEIIK